ncbi:MAG: SLBB domain-containing protein [Rikenellaceae bacterium]
MKNLKFIVLSLATVAFIGATTAQSISPEMLQQAAAMGYSEADVRAQMGAQGGGSTTTTAPRNADGQTLRTAPQTIVVEEEIIPAPQPIEVDTKEQTFGESFFRNSNVSFEPSINIPTPKDYTLTSGDEVVITIWGDTELLYKETISPDGVINVPNYGPVNLSGMTVEQAQKSLESRLSKAYNSLGKSSQLMLSVGQIRSIKVNVSGEVINPGAYTVPSLANLFHIMHLSGGVTKIGDLRNIELYRDSKLVTSLDLYDYILNGNAAGNTILQDGDVVVVKPYSVRVAVDGEVKRPMRYQMKGAESVEDLINFVGGFNEDAYTLEVKIYRNNGENREIIMVNSADFASTNLSDGDSVLISKANNEYKNIISIDGAVWRGGDFQFDEQVNTLSTLIEKAGGLMGNAFASRGIIRRRNDDYTYSTINFVTLDAANGTADVALQNYDEVYIPKVEDLREDFTVSIAGEVNAPKTIGYQDSMKIEDLIILAGGLKESASLATLDVTRRIKNPMTMEYSEDIAETFNFQINEDLTLNASSSDFVLKPFDVVVVRRSPQYKEQSTIFIMGEVLFPGTYSLSKDNTYLSDVIEMAQGTTPNAYIKGTSLTRRAAKTDRDTRDVNNSDLFTVEDISSQALNQLKSSTAGRDTLDVTTESIRSYLVGVDMQKALKDPKGEEDILLQEGDIVLIPKRVNIVNIIGSVNYPNATTYSTKKLKHYIGEGGGYNKLAIRKPFVIYPNGKVAATKSVCLFFKKRPKVDPGCIVVVPAKANRERASMAETISAVSSMASVASSISTLGVALGK